MIDLFKDIISFFVYIFYCPFKRNRRAILVYHSIDSIPLSVDPCKVNVPPTLFEQHMSYIAKDIRRFIISFDDGYESVYSNAFPVTKKFGISSILFLTTDFIDGKIDFECLFRYPYSPKALSWAEINEMHKNGLSLGSHGRTHRIMSLLNDKDLFEEFENSKNRIYAMTGCDVSIFSYPYGSAGSFDRRTENFAEKAGYSRTYTNLMGMRDGSMRKAYLIPRIRIYPTDSMIRFRMKVAGAYNWVDVLAGKLGKSAIDRSLGKIKPIYGHSRIA